ncbi:hypothetical protein BSIN_0395 [Burkholderia singularis]|uniref:Uncharacterized protein n=1 Tax=Burkholderia singularis TaxID=1503053 RepID=A0A238H6G5_9BURK|nr:hypothetical protein BSIN_0395 [Burkholderia singularis]
MPDGLYIQTAILSFIRYPNIPSDTDAGMSSEPKIPPISSSLTSPFRMF